MDKIYSPHDKFVRETLCQKDMARDFLSNYLPEEVLALIDLDFIEISKDTFIEKHLKAYYSDLLYKVALGDEPGYIYLLLEHKSREDKLVSLQLLGYICNIWNLHLKQNNGKSLPIIIPLVLYHGRQRWAAGIRLVDLIQGPAVRLARYIPDFEFILIDLTRYSDEEIKGTLLARTFLVLLKYIFSPELKKKLPEILSLFFELEKQETGLKSLETYLTYLFNATDDITSETFMDIIEKTNPHQKGGAIMTLAEQFFEKGRLEGEKKGLQKGRLEGEERGLQQGRLEGERLGIISSIELALSLKFGDVDPGYLSQIKKVQDVDVLKDILKRVYVADDLSDLKELLG